MASRTCNLLQLKKIILANFTTKLQLNVPQWFHYITIPCPLFWNYNVQLIYNYWSTIWQLIILKDLQIVQFIESVNVGIQVDWNGVLKCLQVCTYRYHYLYTSNFSKLDDKMFNWYELIPLWTTPWPHKVCILGHGWVCHGCIWPVHTIVNAIWVGRTIHCDVWWSMFFVDHHLPIWILFFIQV
jgi:hypothetical protein